MAERKNCAYSIINLAISRCLLKIGGTLYVVSILLLLQVQAIGYQWVEQQISMPAHLDSQKIQ